MLFAKARGGGEWLERTEDGLLLLDRGGAMSPRESEEEFTLTQHY